MLRAALLAALLTLGATASATEPIEASVRLVKGEIRSGETAIFLVTITNKSNEPQPLGELIGSSWHVQYQTGKRSGDVVEGSTGFRKSSSSCSKPTMLKPGASSSFEMKAELGYISTGPVIFMFGFELRFSNGDCQHQNVYSSLPAEILPRRKAPSRAE